MDKLVYNTQDGSLSGFINLPANLSEGNHILSTTISDRMGNAGTSKISFMIDNTPPIVIKRSIMATPKQITLPFVENVSGLDRSAMTFRVFQGSMEVFGKTQVDNSTVIFIPSSGILDGSYTIDYSLRDLVGNSASLESATVTVSSFAADMVSAASDEARITKLECGPSPFNPATSVCYFKYELSEPANVELNIFSFQGSIIFKKSLTPASTADRIIWDGKDCYGNISQAGVYPFVMVIKDDSGRRDIKRGKLIIF